MRGGTEEGIGGGRKAFGHLQHRGLLDGGEGSRGEIDADNETGKDIGLGFRQQRPRETAKMGGKALGTIG